MFFFLKPIERKARLYHITEELESAMIYSYSFQKGSRIASVKATQPSFLKALPQTGKRVDEGGRRDRILKYMTKILFAIHKSKTGNQVYEVSLSVACDRKLQKRESVYRTKKLKKYNAFRCGNNVVRNLFPFLGFVSAGSTLWQGS